MVDVVCVELEGKNVAKEVRKEGVYESEEKRRELCSECKGREVRR
jgi:hypothetical protein